MLNFRLLGKTMRCSIFITVLMLIAAVRTAAQDTLVLNDLRDLKNELPLFAYCSIYEETGDIPLTFEEARRQDFIPFSDIHRQARSTDRPLLIQWKRFTVRNSSSDTLRFFVNVGAHYFARLYDHHGELARTGIYETRAEGFYKAVMPLTLQPETLHTFWIRSEDRRGHLVPPWISVETPSAFAQNSMESARRDRLLFLLLGSLTGCLFFMSLFTAFQYFLYRDKAFLWYIIYTMASAFVGLFWIDIRHQFGLFSSLFHDLIFSVFLFIIPVFYTLFIGEILQLSSRFPRGWQVVRVLMSVAVLQMLIEFITMRTGRFWFPDGFGYFISMVPVTLLNLLLLLMTVLSKDKVKWFMFGGLMSMLVLWCSPMLIPHHMEITWSMVNVLLIFMPFYFLLGLVIEAICFAFALAYKSKLVLMEKNRLQEQYNTELQATLSFRTSQLEAQNRLVEQQKIQEVQTSFEKKIAETEMTALRAQMNPHFIFNCLNSIKLYTLENDSETASSYLTMFSQLIRLVLDNSRSEKISLMKELQTLRLYIELEAMRFKNKISYHIIIPPDLDQQFTEIPPMLIQPYVENAIWHGLMHKKEGGLLEIKLSAEEEHFLLVEITDDGIGREQAVLFKSKSATRHKSFGLKMTSERIDMIHQIYGIRADVQVTDLKDHNNKPCGTRVTLKIPI